MSRSRGRPPKNREAISTRLYTDTVRILRILAELRRMSMADFAHQLALDAMLAMGPGIRSEIDDLMKEAKRQKEEVV
jgi:hypothetical protein